MVIVQINYRRPDMPKAEWEARYTDDRATQFLAVPGLLWKIWLDGDAERSTEPAIHAPGVSTASDRGLAGGIYLFESRAAAEAYVAGPIVARMRANPDLSELDIRLFEVRERMSAITRAPLPHLRAAAE